jgi:hypothetical protein
MARERSARVLAGKCVAMSLPARTRAHRLGAAGRHLTLKDHKSVH